MKLRLRVNRAKSAVARTPERQFLGFTLYWDKDPRAVRLRISDKALKSFKEEIRSKTSRVRRIPEEALFAELNRYMQGWAGYYARFWSCETQLTQLDPWIRIRVRQWFWVQWKTPANRFRNLRKGGVWKAKAEKAIWTRSAWKAAQGQAVSNCLNNQRLQEAGLMSLKDYWRRFATS